MSISVIIISKDRQALLDEALASAVGQRLQPTEIIVVDDGSICPVEVPWLDSGIPVRVIRQQQQGASAARNTGARHASGHFLAFLDDDDLWDADYLEKVVSCAEQHEAGLVVTWMDTLNGELRGRGKRIAPDLLDNELYSSNPGVTGSNILFTSALFQRLDGFDESLMISEDKDILIRSIPLGTVAVLQNALVQHRIHTSSRLSDNIRNDKTKMLCKEYFLKKHSDSMPPASRSRMFAELAGSYILFKCGYAKFPVGIIYAFRSVWARFESILPKIAELSIKN
ncbi:glycosyltransferase [Pseudodesulfovibrio sp.]|nr:glycosyltransferase [Pseudodesulfovibrio sp.]